MENKEKDKLEEDNVIINAFEELNESKLQNLRAIIAELFHELAPGVGTRLYIYLVIFFVFSVVLFGKDKTGSSHINGVSAMEWYKFLGVVVGVEFVMVCLDVTFFHVFDAVWRGPDIFRLYAHCFKGGLGLVCTVLIINIWFGDMKVPQSYNNWGDFMSVIICIVICFIARRFYQRKSFSSLIVTRFGDKLATLEMQVLILSRLASWQQHITPLKNPVNVIERDISKERRPRSRSGSGHSASSLRQKDGRSTPTPIAKRKNSFPVSLKPGEKPEELRERVDSISSDPGTGASIQMVQPKRLPDIPEETLSATSSTKSSVIKSDQPLSVNPISSLPPAPPLSVEIPAPKTQSQALEILKNLSFMSKVKEILYAKHDLHDIFAEIVKSDEDEEEEASVSIRLDEGGSDVKLSSLSYVTKFWDRLSQVSTGTVRIRTYNGEVALRKVSHGINFGDKLTRHLVSRRCHGKVFVAPKRRHNPVTSTLVVEILTLTSHPKDEYSNEALIKEAMLMFHSSKDMDLIISREQIISSCKQVVKDNRNIVVAINDFLSLHKSLDNVMDVFFWCLMFIIAQILLQWDTLSLLAPLFTLLVSVSFALSMLLGNIFLAIGYSLFILPYDVGDKVVVGVGSTRIVGKIESVALLSTTMITIYNERLQIPHNTLYSEKIFNYRSSKQACLEIPVSFALNGPSAVKIAVIREFFQLVRAFMLEEKAEDWADVSIFANGMDSTQNTLTYSLWCTNRCSFYQAGKLYGDKTALLERMYELKEELGISFMSVSQHVDVIGIGAPGGGGAGGTASARGSIGLDGDLTAM